MPALKGVAFNTIISVSARTIGLALAFFSLGITARYLGPSGAGEYFTVLAFCGIFSVFSDLGLYQIFLRHISLPGADEKKVLANFLSLRLLSLFIVLWVIAPVVAWLMPYSPEIKKAILIGCAIYTCLSLNTLLIGVFQKYLRMEYVAYSELLSRLLQVMVLWAVLRNGGGFGSALAAVFIASFFQISFLFWRTKGLVKISIQADRQIWKSIVKDSLPVALAAIFSFIYFKIDSVMISVLKPARDVGIYGLAYKILETIVAYPAIYVGLLVPSLTRSFSENRNKFLNIMAGASTIISFMTMPMLAGGLVLAPKMVHLFGKGYEESATALMILLGAATFIFYGTLFSNAIISAGMQKKLAKIYFYGMILNILANIYAISRWSYLGASWTTLLTEAGVTAAMIVVLHKKELFDWQPKKILLSALAAAVMGAIIYFFDACPVWLLLPAGGIIYFVAGSVLGIFGRKELKEAMAR